VLVERKVMADMQCGLGRCAYGTARFCCSRLLSAEVAHQGNIIPEEADKLPSSGARAADFGDNSDDWPLAGVADWSCSFRLPILNIGCCLCWA